MKLTQPIRAELPPEHQAKRGTPLMAGLILLTGVVTSTYFHPKPLVLFIGSTAFQDPSGMSGKAKLIFQFAFTTILLILLLFQFNLSSEIIILKDFQ